MRLIRRAVPAALLTGLAATGLAVVPGTAAGADGFVCTPVAAVEPPAPGAGVAPDAVHGLAAAAGFDYVDLTWTAPDAPDWTNVVVRMTPHGTTPPATISDGYRVHVGPGQVLDTVALGLHPGNSYAFSVFTVDSECLVSLPASIVVRGTTITLATSARSVVYGEGFTLSGKLTIPGNPSSSHAIDIWAREVDDRESWVYVDYAVTDSAGRFTAPVTPGLSYEYVAVYYGSGDSTGMGSQSLMIPVSVKKDVTVSANRSTIRKGTGVTISASVWPESSGKKLTLQRLVDGAWRTVTTGTTSRTRASTFTVTPKSRGKHVYRVLAAKGGGLAEGVSRRLTITVT